MTPCNCRLTLTDRDIPRANRTEANLWRANCFESLREIAKANRGIGRLRRRLAAAKARQSACDVETGRTTTAHGWRLWCREAERERDEYQRIALDRAIRLDKREDEARDLRAENQRLAKIISDLEAIRELDC